MSKLPHTWIGKDRKFYACTYRPDGSEGPIYVTDGEATKGDTFIGFRKLTPRETWDALGSAIGRPEHEDGR